MKEGNEYNCSNGFPRFYSADPGVPNYEEYREMILSLSDLHLVTVKSLKNSMKRDAEVAAEEGRPLTWKTKVKESDGSKEFTHEQSVRLHLALMTEIRKDEEYERGLWTWECISVIWGLIVSSTTVPEAQEFLFDWLSKNFIYISREARTKLVDTFSLCPDAYKRSTGSYRFYNTCCVENADYTSDFDPSDL